MATVFNHAARLAARSARSSGSLVVGDTFRAACIASQHVGQPSVGSARLHASSSCTLDFFIPAPGAGSGSSSS